MTDTREDSVSDQLERATGKAAALQQAAFETRTSDSLIQPSTADTHPPGVPDPIATQTPIAAGRYHVVLPQGKEWENTRPHAVWHAYDGRIEAFEHPSAPDDTDWWLILQKSFDGQAWGYGPSCIARTPDRAGEIIEAFLNGDRDAIRTTRRELPDHVTESTTTITEPSGSAEEQTSQNVLGDFQ